MLISQAFAQGTGGGGLFGGMDQLQQFLPLVLIFVVFYFLLLRPQQKKAKMHREMVSNLRRGDRVLSSGGMFGSVTKVLNEREVQVEIAEGVRVRMLRSAVTEVVAKTEPVSGKDDDEKDSKGSKAANDAEDGDSNESESAAPPAPPPSPAIAPPASLLDRILGRK